MVAYKGTGGPRYEIAIELPLPGWRVGMRIRRFSGERRDHRRYAARLAQSVLAESRVSHRASRSSPVALRGRRAQERVEAWLPVPTGESWFGHEPAELTEEETED